MKRINGCRFLLLALLFVVCLILIVGIIVKYQRPTLLSVDKLDTWLIQNGYANVKIWIIDTQDFFWLTFPNGYNLGLNSKDGYIEEKVLKSELDKIKEYLSDDFTWLSHAGLDQWLEDSNYWDSILGTSLYDDSIDIIFENDYILTLNTINDQVDAGAVKLALEENCDNLPAGPVWVPISKVYEELSKVNDGATREIKLIWADDYIEVDYYIDGVFFDNIQINNQTWCVDNGEIQIRRWKLFNLESFFGLNLHL